ncbi:MAG: efflux RND transporter periplasmic adaptor subunit [Bacillota bacterium]
MKIKAIIVSIMAMCLFVGCEALQEQQLSLTNATQEEDIAETEVEEEVVTLRSVEVATVETQEVSNVVKYSGRVSPSKQMSVTPMMAGKVTSSSYKVGDYVAEGAVLFEIDDQDLQDNMRSLEANYAITELAFKNAERMYENNAVLFQEGIIAQTDMDQLTYSYESSKANLYSLEVQMETLRHAMEYTTVTSPLSGVVTQKNIETGDVVSQGTPTYVIVDLSPVTIQVGVSEQLVNSVRVGDRVSVLITAASVEPFQGTVTTINPVMDQTSTYPIGISVPNSGNLIKSGMLSEVTFVLESVPNAVMIPASAIITKNDGSYVYVAERHEDGTSIVKETLITTGIQTGEYVQAVTGLAVGEEIVVKGQGYLIDDEAVNILELSIALLTEEEGAEEEGTEEESESEASS